MTSEECIVLLWSRREWISRSAKYVKSGQVLAGSDFQLTLIYYVQDVQHIPESQSTGDIGGRGEVVEALLNTVDAYASLSATRWAGCFT